MFKSLITSFGSIFTAFIASSCCIGPLAFTLLGIGGIGFGASFEKYRSILLVATALLLGISYYFAYRKPKEICIDGKCEIEQVDKTRNVNKFILWISAIVAILFLFIPQLLLVVL